MTRYSDFNDIKLKKVCDTIGVDKFLELTEAINGQIYIPKKTAFIQMCRKTPSFSYGDIRHVHRIYASN